MTSEPLDDEPAPVGTRHVPLVLFVLTTASTFAAGAFYQGEHPLSRAGLFAGAAFAVPLLSILLFHEFGHYIAARLHGVPVSLPHFIPMPFLSPLGTMGAIIGMPERIRSRNALLDIGAAGPLAGLAVTLVVLVVGLRGSVVGPLDGPYIQEGQSLGYLLMKRLVLGPIPPGYDVTMNGTAFAGWAGLFVTALNLIPVGQLDGGHIAYALFGERQNRYATWIHRSLLLVFAYNLIRHALDPEVSGLADIVGNSTFYLVWFVILRWMHRRAGQNHPPTDLGDLSPKRRWIAALSLGIFVVLFMPTPWAQYEGPPKPSAPAEQTSEVGR